MRHIRLPEGAFTALFLFVQLLVPAALPAAESNGALTLNVYWPPDGSRVGGSEIRVGGRTHPEASVTVNGKDLRVYPTGAFAGTASLEIGSNTIVYRARRGDGTKTVRRTVYRTRPLRTSPRSPIRLDPAYDGTPSDDLEVRPGDTIRIRTKGSPGQKGTFRIGSGNTHYPLYETSSGGVDGFYEGVYEVRDGDRFVKARITCYLAPRSDPGDYADKKLLPTHVTVLRQPFAEAARVREDYTQLRAEPSGGMPLAMARAGTYLNVVGRQGSRLKVHLSPSLHGWVYESQVSRSRSEAPNRRGDVRNLSVVEERDATVLQIPLGLRVPFAATGQSDSAVELTLFGVNNRLNWITDRTPNGVIEAIAAVPAGDETAKFLLSVRNGNLLGFRGYYEGDNFYFAVRPLPLPTESGKPLAGRTILVDPGHGGSSLGTIGSTGLAEKTINLTLSKMLEKHLEARGAGVEQVRSTDSDVPLDRRSAFAENHLGADLFVSIHNNSIGLTGDPLAARGVGVFYYHSHSRDVARAVYDRMLEVEPRPRPYGVVRADFHVCREITWMPSVLLECLFLSNPEDEMLLLDEDFADRYMEKVAQGIGDWFAAASKRSASTVAAARGDQ